MLTNLFKSKIRIEVLSTFFSDPDRDFYVREIEKMTGEDYRNISRELRNLENIGLLNSRKEGNLKYFTLNREFLLFGELKSIFLKTRGAAALLKEALSQSAQIEFAFIYGSVASGKDTAKSDIDVMVIGEIPLEDLLRLITGTEDVLGREVNPSLFGREEIMTRLKEKDPFIL
ncbi:MAG: nucleotidyltransferase domain-containing protein, partial [Syntrophales bacterium]|nr:nucleotidyltransferase domain-containing protein [Syntrophales bacterium]